MTDAIDHPAHYTAHPSGVECIQVTEHMGFNLGNAVKYIWRRMQIGYNRAAALIERLQHDGYISPADIAGRRTVLVRLEGPGE